MLSVASSLVFLVFLGVGEACWPPSMPAHRERFNVSDVEFTRLDGVGICGGAMFNVGPKADPHTLGHCLLRCANQTDCSFVVFKYHNVSSVNDNVTDADGNQTAWIMAKGICFEFRCRSIDYWKNNTATLQAVTMVKNDVLLPVTAEEPYYPDDLGESTDEYEDEYDAIDANLTAAAALIFSTIENATLAEENNTSPTNPTEDPLIRIMAPNDAEPSNLQVVFSNIGDIQEQEQNGINDFPANLTDVTRAKVNQTLYGGRFDPDHGERSNGNDETIQAIAATSSNSASIGASLEEQKQHRHRPGPKNPESMALFNNGTGHQTEKEALLSISSSTEQNSSRNTTSEAEAESRPHSADDDESLPQGSTKPKTINRVLQEAGREEEGVLAVLNDYDGLVELGNGTNSGVNVTSLPGKIKEDPTIESKLKGRLNQSFDNVGEDKKLNGSDASVDQKNPGGAEKNPQSSSKIHRWNQEEDTNITVFKLKVTKVGSENDTNVVDGLPANENENASLESLAMKVSNGSLNGRDDAKEMPVPGANVSDAGKPEAKGLPENTPKGSSDPGSNSDGGDGKSGEKEVPGNAPNQNEKLKEKPNPAGKGFGLGIGEGPGSGGNRVNQKLNQ